MCACDQNLYFCACEYVCVVHFFYACCDMNNTKQVLFMTKKKMGACVSNSALAAACIGGDGGS